MKWGAKITFGMLVVSVIFSTVVLGRNLWMQEKEQSKFEDLRGRITDAKKKNSLKEQAEIKKLKKLENMVGEERLVLPEYQELAEENPDFAGWISIQGTNIDYPVMQTPWEPEHYLHQNFTGEYSYAGVPFVGFGDMREEKGDIFLWGHNMRSGTMFADLLKYRERQYLRNHSVLHLDTLLERREYEVFAVLDVTEAEWSSEDGLFHSYESDFTMNREAYLEKLKKQSLYQSGITADVQDQLLFLVTCSYQKENGRIVIVGRKI